MIGAGVDEPATEPAAPADDPTDVGTAADIAADIADGGAEGRSQTDRRRTALWWLVVVAAALAGFGARTWNIDFDQRQHLHPDERHWALTASSLSNEASPPASYPGVLGPALTWLDGQRSPANPYRGTDSFVYGATPLAAGRAVAGWLADGVSNGDEPARTVVRALDRIGIPLVDDTGAARFDDGYNVDLIGRLLGAVLDTVTVIVVALIGRRLLRGRRGEVVGAVAAWLYAGVVISVQHAHYFGSEPALALAAACTVLALLRVRRHGDLRSTAASCALAGFAAGATVAIKFTGIGLAMVPFALLGWLAVSRRTRADVGRLVAAGTGAFVAFRILSPAAFRGLTPFPSSTFWDDLERSRAATNAGLPPSIQWADRNRVVDGTWWLVESWIGPGIAIAGVAGLVAVAVAVRRRAIGRWNAAVLALTVVVPYAFVFRDQVVTGRYFVPMVPSLCVAAALAYVELVRWCQRHPGTRAARLGTAVVVVGLAATAAWTASYLHGVHGHPHTRITATEWIGANVPAGSVISAEAWDDALPLAVGGVQPTLYESEQLDLFGPDDVDKVGRVARQLARIDYVVESSPRVWNTVVRIPARYPSTIELFDALDDGRLGFRRVATITSTPRLGAFAWEGGDESFSVVDHPEVRIWERVRDIGPEETFAVLRPDRAARAMAVHPDRATAQGTMLTTDELARSADVGTFDSEFATTGVGANAVVQTVAWLLVVSLLAAATWVLLLPVLGRLPDAGVGAAATIGLVVVTGGVIVIAGAGIVDVGRPLVGGLVASIALGAAVTARRRRDVVVATWREKRRSMSHAVAASSAGFAIGLAVRLADPDLWHPYRGGEKPFELAMLTSVLRSRTVPPPDVWFAGGSLNYYYGGSLLVGVPARLVRTTPELSMNLGIALVVMLAAGACWTAGAALAATGAAGRRTTTMAGWLGAMLVLVVPSASIVDDVVGRLARQRSGPLDWWGLSRVVEGSPIVTEFPAWTILFADLHAHLIGLPLVAVGVVSVVAVADAVRRDAGPAVVVAAGALAGLVIGAMRAVNAWDLPIAASAFALVLVVGAAMGRLRPMAAAAGGAIVTGWFVWRPFVRRFEVSDAGIERNRMATSVPDFFEHWGVWALVTATVTVTVIVTVLSVAEATTTASRPGAWGWSADRLGRMPRQRQRLVVAGGLVALGLVALGLVAVVVAVGGFVCTIALVLAALAIGAALAACRAGVLRPAAAPLALTGYGWLVVAGTELVSVVNDFDRMNTVFKWWFHAWVLIALGSAATIATLIAERAPSGATTEPVPSARSVHVVRRGVALATLASLAMLAGAFVQLAVPARLDDRISPPEPSLDGFAFTSVIGEVAAGLDPADDEPLIAWLRAEVDGRPTILEAPGQGYAWTARIAGRTGLPTVVGWPYHLSQQRRAYGAAVDRRMVDVTEFYASADTSRMLDVLWRYDVGLIVVGSTESVVAGEAGIEAIRALPCTTIDFDDGRTFDSRVDRDCVAGRAVPFAFAATG